MPEQVIRRMVDAFKRKDVDATFADYDSVFYHVSAGDTLVERAKREAWIMKLKADTGLATFLRTVEVADVSIDVRGSWARLVWTFRGPDPKTRETRTWKYFNVLQVRGGKIVYEIEA